MNRLRLLDSDISWVFRNKVVFINYFFYLGKSEFCQGRPGVQCYNFIFGGNTIFQRLVDSHILTVSDD